MSDIKQDLTRRSILSTAWTAAAVGAGLAGRLAGGDAGIKDQGEKLPATAVPAGTQSAGRDRTLVCVYLLGGSDGNSMVAPLEPSQYTMYAKTRGALALLASALLPVRDNATGLQYGFDPRLAEIQRYFQEGSAAVAANVGPAVRPAEGNRYEYLRFLSDGCATPGWAAGKVGYAAANDRVFTFDQGVTVMPLGTTSVQGERRKNPALLEKIASVSLRTSFPDTPLGKQMKTIAGVLKAGDVTKGSGGQVVFSSIGGFGPSRVQTMAQPLLLKELSSAMAALYQATVEMGVSDQVTIFTDSEFGRTLRPNANHTSGPGWGNHQLVLGGAVRGGRIYGKYPDMVSGPFDSDSALVPTTSEAQYQATLAGWMGISSGELKSLLPGLDDKATLGFLPT